MELRRAFSIVTVKLLVVRKVSCSTWVPFMLVIGVIGYKFKVMECSKMCL